MEISIANEMCIVGTNGIGGRPTDLRLKSMTSVLRGDELARQCREDASIVTPPE
jgi:hypothetical protein